MTFASAIRMMKPAAASSDFDPTILSNWISLFWAEGSTFAAEGYSDGDDILVWPDEVGGMDLDERLWTGNPGAIKYRSASTMLNSRPAVTWEGCSVTSPRSLMQSAGNRRTGSSLTDLSAVTITYLPNAWQTSLVIGISKWDNKVNLEVSSGNRSVAVNSYQKTSYTYGTDGDDVPALFVGHTEANVTVEGWLNGNTFSAAHSRSSVWDSDRAIIMGGGSNDHGVTEINQGLTDTAVALAGYISGDVLADPNWDDFVAAAATYYGITVV